MNTFLVQGPNLIINQPDKLLDGMSAWCQEHHGKVSFSLHSFMVNVFSQMMSHGAERRCLCAAPLSSAKLFVFRACLCHGCLVCYFSQPFHGAHWAQACGPFLCRMSRATPTELPASRVFRSLLGGKLGTCFGHRRKKRDGYKQWGNASCQQEEAVIHPCKQRNRRPGFVDTGEKELGDHRQLRHGLNSMTRMAQTDFFFNYHI